MKNLTVLSIFLLIVFSFSSCNTNTTEPVVPDEEVTLSKNAAGKVGINIILNTAIDNKIVAELRSYGNVMDLIYEINALRILAKAEVLPSIKALPYVESAGFDAERNASPIDPLEAIDFSDGLSTWNLDAVNVTEFGFDNRSVSYDGEDVITLILDTGLLDSWRQYFPQERILSEYAKSFGGGGVAGLNVSEQPNKWEHDQNSHGTHVISTILGYSLDGTPINGVAPKVSVIPVKVLNQDGSGWSSIIAKGIIYAADLKESEFSNYPVVVNMSLSGPALDPLEKAAVDYAVSKGVIIVASAGNRGSLGMGYPGAYEPVISVAAAGPNFSFMPFGINEAWWFNLDVPEDINSNFYGKSLYSIPSWSSRALQGQDLDVTAPGALVVGPYQLQSGKTSYYFLSGTSMAAPHVTGIVALMLQKNSSLTPALAESYLESAALDLGYNASIQGSGFITADAVLSLVP